MTKRACKGRNSLGRPFPATKIPPEYRSTTNLLPRLFSGKMSKIPVSHVGGIKTPSCISSTPLEANKKMCIPGKKELSNPKFSDSIEYSIIEKSTISSTKSTPREPLKMNNGQLKRSASSTLVNVSRKQPKLTKVANSTSRSINSTSRSTNSTAKVTNTTAKIAPYEALYNDISQKYTDLKDESSELKRKIDHLSDQVQVEQNKVESYENEKIQLFEELERSKSENNKLILELRETTDNKNKENSDLSAQLSEAKIRLSYKTGEYDKLKDIMEKEIAKNFELSSALSDSQNKLSSCTSEITFLKSKQAILEKKNHENDDLISNMKIESENMTEKLKILKEQDESLKTNLDLKIQESNKFSELYDAEKLQCSTLLSKNVELLTELNSLRAYKEHLEKKNEEHCNTIDDLNKKKEELHRNLESMYEIQKVLRNDVQDLKGHIRVFCRVKPVLKEDTSKVALNVDIVDSCTMDIEKVQVNSTSGLTKKQNMKHTFAFDGIFPSHSSQAEIFTEVSSLIQSALDGYNVCIFAYGQTGSGKTYTMEGEAHNNSSGIIPRTIDMIFEKIPSLRELGWEFKITASFLEIYNENIYDLLDPNKDQIDHSIKMVDSKGIDVYVSNLKEESVNNSDELRKLLNVSQKNRQTAATLCNERSSRSHSVTKIKITATNKQREQKYYSYLNLVDLAGSESGKTSQRMNETKSINKSLSELSKVILALQAKQTHVPYRNSKLTYLLMPSLGGNSKTLMLVNVSQLDDCYNETLNSLRFASKVNSCRTGASKKNISSM